MRPVGARRDSVRSAPVNEAGSSRRVSERVEALPSGVALRRRLRPVFVAAVLQNALLWVPIEKLFITEIGFDSGSVAIMAAAYGCGPATRAELARGGYALPGSKPFVQSAGVVTGFRVAGERSAPAGRVREMR
jgi:hypothetical protein